MRSATVFFVGLLTSTTALAGLLDEFSDADRVTGLKDALQQGAANALAKLGRENGYFDNQKVKIPLPPTLKKAEGMLRAVGMKKQAEELVLSMNRAAEAAVPEARSLLVDAVKGMSVQDAASILRGGEDAATQYFRKSTEEPLRGKFLPIVTRATEKIGLANQYNQFASKAAKLRLMNEKDANVQGYVTQKALDGLFLMMAEDEKSIRQNPIKATTEIAKRIFDVLKR
jgi:hypothetical protein